MKDIEIDERFRPNFWKPRKNSNRIIKAKEKSDQNKEEEIKSDAQFSNILNTAKEDN